MSGFRFKFSNPTKTNFSYPDPISPYLNRLQVKRVIQVDLYQVIEPFLLNYRIIHFFY